MLKKLLFAALAALALSSPIAHAQSANPFTPDFAWCRTQGAIATRNGDAWGCLVPGTAGQVLRTNGAGANASWQTVTGSGTVTSVGLALPTGLTVTGSPITGAGTLTGAWASQTAKAFLAAPTASAGTPTFRAMVAADMPNSGAVAGNLNGTWPTLNINGNTVTNAMLQATAVTAAKVVANTLTNTTLATMPTMTVKSNITGATATPADNTVTAMLDAEMGAAQGTIAFRGATDWQGLAPSTGSILQSNGAGANPSWVSPSAAIPAAVGIGHRLTLSTGTPILTGTVSAAATIYSTPYQSDLLLLWDGTNFVPTHCAEFSQALSDTTKSPAAAVANSAYDLFAWNDGGVCRLSRGPVWTNVTTRSAGTAIARTNFGILTNTTAITNGPGASAGTYMGTIKTDAGGATVSFIPATTSATCAQAMNGIWNYYNRVSFDARLLTTRSSYSYSAGVRAAAGDANCSIQYITGLVEDGLSASQSQQTSGASVGNGSAIAIGLNSTTTAAGAWSRFTAAASAANAMVALYNGMPALGLNTIYALEATSGNANTFNSSDNWSLLLEARY